MQLKEKQITFHGQQQSYAKWLLSELNQQGVEFSVVESGLSVKGEMTPLQKENVRLWKRQIIETLSPECSKCTMPLNLIENGNAWFCPFGCESKEVN